MLIFRFILLLLNSFIGFGKYISCVSEKIKTTDLQQNEELKTDIIINFKDQGNQSVSSL